MIALLWICFGATFLGVAAQGVAFYVLLLFVLRIIVQHEKVDRKPYLWVGVACLCIYFVFPATNLIANVFQSSLWNQYLNELSNLLKFYEFASHSATPQATPRLQNAISVFSFNRVSSAFLVLGIGFVSCQWLPLFAISNKKTKSHFFNGINFWVSEKNQQNISLEVLFIFSVFLILQSYTGLDLRKGFGVLSEEHRQLGNWFRVFGFYGHPLSIASVGLILCGVPLAFRYKPENRKFLLFLFGIGFLWCLLSGGRTASVLACACIILFAFRIFRKFSIAFSLGLFFVLGALVFLNLVPSLNFLNRFNELNELFGTNPPDRFKFWIVHWKLFLDAPWFGQGASALESGLRTFEYHNMGYANLKDKFNAHNIFLESLASTGLAGCTMLLAAIIVGAKNAQKTVLFFSAKVQNQSERFFTAKSICSLPVILIALNFLHGLTQNTFFDSNVSYVYLNFYLFFVCYAFERNRTSKTEF